MVKISDIVWFIMTKIKPGVAYLENVRDVTQIFIYPNIIQFTGFKKRCVIFI